MGWLGFGRAGYQRSQTDQWSLAQVIQWMEANGWTVRAWPEVGARGWLDDLLPVRSAAQIMRKRQEFQDFNPYGAALKVARHTLDFRYDL